MYEDLGFKGDVQGYYSPANSLLHSVMSRRLGIPLTLSIVFMEIGWRLGIPFEGVGFPGHFLVRLAGEPGDLLLDPYDHGVSVHEEDCRRMIELTTGGTVPFDPSMIRSLGKRDMVAAAAVQPEGGVPQAGDDKVRCPRWSACCCCTRTIRPSCAIAGCCSTAWTAIAKRARDCAPISGAGRRRSIARSSSGTWPRST
jgi:hypothetical protein